MTSRRQVAGGLMILNAEAVAAGQASPQIIIRTRFWDDALLDAQTVWLVEGLRQYLDVSSAVDTLGVGRRRPAAPVSPRSGSCCRTGCGRPLCLRRPGPMCGKRGARTDDRARVEARGLTGRARVCAATSGSAHRGAPGICPAGCAQPRGHDGGPVARPDLRSAQGSLQRSGGAS